jgi:hypothetical protein
LKLSYSIQVPILMLCAKYQEAGLCGSWEICDWNNFVTPTTSVQYAGDTITVLDWNTVTNWYINISTQIYWQGASSQHSGKWFLLTKRLHT